MKTSNFTRWLHSLVPMFLLTTGGWYISTHDCSGLLFDMDHSSFVVAVHVIIYSLVIMTRLKRIERKLS
jgi:hypothetical protein